MLPVARMSDHTIIVYVDVKVSPKMSWTGGKVVSEGNGPAYQYESGSGEPTMAKTLRVLKRGSEEMDSHFDKMKSHSDQQDE